ncbi:hypothetical protein [Hyphococcus lacteus]|uniref:DUF2029 domain-containing protein n=1 Tax=Hyphococcus lacteus TaxID=3143536 RepID=A0ABV3YZM4_9PROT
MTAFRNILNVLAPIAFIAGLAHLIFQLMTHWSMIAPNSQLIWLAGQSWTIGASPYQADLAWQPMPAWMPIASFLSLMDPLLASRVLMVVTTGLLLGASALNVSAFYSFKDRTILVSENKLTDFFRSQPPVILFFFHVSFVALSQSAAFGLQLGGAPALVYFGASLLIRSAIGKRELSCGASLCILFFVPTVAILTVPALALSAYGRRVIALGVLLTFIISAPALAITPAPDMISAIINSHQNLPEYSTGLRHFMFLVGAPDLGTIFYTLLALTVTCAVGLTGRNSNPRLKTIDNLMAALAVMMVVAPLEPAYFLLVGSILLYGAGLRPPLGAIALFAALLFWRGSNFPGLPISDVHATTSFYVSVGALILALTLLLSSINAPRPSHRSSSHPMARAAISRTA